MWILNNNYCPVQLLIKLVKTPKCVVPSCKFKNSNGIKRSFFSCQNVERARLWEKYIPGIDFLNPSDYICDIHFEKSHKISCNHVRHGQYYTVSLLI